jgi:hypothetical protein
LFHALFLHVFVFSPEDGDNLSLQDICWLSTECIVSQKVEFFLITKPQVPQKTTNFVAGWVTSSCSKRILPHSYFAYLHIYCNWFDQRVAKQRLCKHGPTHNNRRGCVFYVVRATPSAGDRPMNSQSDKWHVFYVGSVLTNYKRFQNNREGSLGGLSWEYQDENEACP